LGNRPTKAQLRGSILDIFEAIIPIHRYPDESGHLKFTILRLVGGHNTTTFISNPIRIFDMDWYYKNVNKLSLPTI